MPDKPAEQVWELTLDGRSHLVEAGGSFSHQVRWYVDGDLVAEKKAAEEKMRLQPTDERGLGTLEVRFDWRGHGRRATLHEPEAGLAAEAGLGGVDLVPEPGSRAAAHEERLRRHPRRYALLAAVVGVGKVVVPILVALLLARLAFRLPLPDIDLPSIPWPDLPDLPDLPLPGLPSPNLPDWSLPGWVVWLLDKAKYVVPVLVAVGLAQGELKRRRDQDAKRAELDAQRRARTDEEPNAG